MTQPILPRYLSILDLMKFSATLKSGRKENLEHFASDPVNKSFAESHDETTLVLY